MMRAYELPVRVARKHQRATRLNPSGLAFLPSSRRKDRTFRVQLLIIVSLMGLLFALREYTARQATTKAQRAALEQGEVTFAHLLRLAIRDGREHELIAAARQKWPDRTVRILTPTQVAELGATSPGVRHEDDAVFAYATTEGGQVIEVRRALKWPNATGSEPTVWPALGWTILPVLLIAGVLAVAVLGRGSMLSVSPEPEPLSIDGDDRQRLARQMEKANRLASIGAMAAGLVHDIGTPLNVITGHATMVAQASSEPEVQEGTRTIREQANRIANLLRDLLDYARGESVRASESTNLLELAKDHVALLQPIALKRHIDLEVKVGAEELPQALIPPVRAVQLLNNLITNAMDAMPQGGTVTIGASATADPTKAFVCIWVTDQGPGVAPEDRERIFQPFYTTKRGAEGSGLGLTVCEGIVRSHGGWIDVHSVPSEPTRFTAHLPAAPAPRPGYP